MDFHRSPYSSSEVSCQIEEIERSGELENNEPRRLRRAIDPPGALEELRQTRLGIGGRVINGALLGHWRAFGVGQVMIPTSIQWPKMPKLIPR
jgi:hypothetical protein